MSRAWRPRGGSLRQRLGQVSGVRALDDAASVVDSLETAVAENRALEVPLERVVSDLERIVAELLESAERRSGGGSPSSQPPSSGDGVRA